MINKKIIENTDIIELNDEYLVIYAINSQMINNIKKNKGFIANKNPKKHATPLPPLNFNQIGKICPIIENNPHSAATFPPKLL